MSASERRSSLAIVAAACLVLQIASATWFARDLQTPNSSTQIAQRLVRDGQFAVDAWHRLRGGDGNIPEEPLRAFQLPGEPLYLAAGLSMMPAWSWRYLHVPVSVVLVTAIAAVAFLIGGRRLSLAAGLCAAFDPFVVFHGPIWDDTFLAAAAEWVILALVLGEVAHADASTRRPAWSKWVVPVLCGVCAAVAAATRLQSQLLLAAIAVLAVVVPSTRTVRVAACAVAIGVALAVGAWGARNAMVFGRFFLGTSHDGLTLFESNYRHARASILETGTAEGFSQSHLDEQFDHVAGFGELDANRQFNREAWNYMVSDPVDVLRTAGLKLAVSVSGLDFKSPLTSGRNLVTLGSNALLNVIGCYGLWLCWRRSRTTAVGRAVFAVAAVAGIMTLGMLTLGPVGLRYRISWAGFLYIGCAVLLLDWALAMAPRVTERWRHGSKSLLTADETSWSR